MWLCLHYDRKVEQLKSLKYLLSDPFQKIFVNHVDYKLLKVTLLANNLMGLFILKEKGLKNIKHTEKLNFWVGLCYTIKVLV